MWELPAAGKPVKKALSPSRAMVHLDRMLVYHDLTYVDAFIMEIPWIKGGEVRHVHAQQLLSLILRGGIVNRTYGLHKNLPGIYLTVITNDIWSY